ncbi:hypothetical protein GCM10028796_17040 [Ramlibacter monticola]|uniref:HK97 gp10 family phage protein n=1 Tax=Ramlibacter monticola TaxID=1926872 RepID=A0A936YXS4_9BURK|nr:HK97 gp10 family phage protein [Ramlibacter monticola]MBL0390531.1 HK97 gp10 family phage protein [Ramlibacter monticola]
MKPSRTSANRSAAYARQHPPVQMPVDLSAFNDMLAGLEEDISQALRPAAQAGAEVIYRAVLQNVDRIGSVSGSLRSSIYQAFVEKDSVELPSGGYSRVRYDVSWNPVKAPHAHLIEYGHIQKFKVYLGADGKWYTNKKAPLPAPKQIAARPFMRPAAYKQGEAAAAVEAAFWKAMQK